MAGFAEIDADLELGPLESICPTCHMVHHTPTGSAFCAEADA